MAKRVAIYTRVSTGKQASEGVSLTDQRIRLSAFAESQRWQVVGTYTDAGASGKDLQRPELQRLLADAEAGKFDCVLAFDLSRLSRDVADWANLRKMLRKRGVAVRLLDGDADDTPGGRAMLNMRAVFAQWQREELAAKMAAFAQARQTRREMWSRIPFGFRLGRDRRLAPVASELATIRRVVELRRRGGTLREVARMVAEDGDAMHPQTVARIASYARPGGMYERLGVRFTA